jgi:hypothetical protein
MDTNCAVTMLRDKQLQKITLFAGGGKTGTIIRWTILAGIAALTLLSFVGAIAYRQPELLLTGPFLLSQVSFLALTLRILVTSLMLSDLRARRVLEDLLGTAITPTHLVDRLTWLNFKDSCKTLCPFWLLVLLGLAMAGSPGFYYVGWLLLPLVLSFYLVAGTYAMMLAAGWGEGFGGIARGVAAVFGLFYGGLLGIAVVAHLAELAFGNGVAALTLGLWLLGLPLTFRKLVVWRLTCSNSSTIAIRNGHPRYCETLARINPILGLQAPKVFRIVLLALIVCAPGLWIQSHLSFSLDAEDTLMISHFISFTLTASLAIWAALSTHLGVRKSITSGSLVLWQMAGISASQAVDGFAMRAVLGPQVALLGALPLALWAGFVYPFVWGAYLWACTYVWLAAYSTVHAASRNGLALGAAMWLFCCWVSVPALLLESGRELEAYALLSLLQVAMAWRARRSACRVLHMPAVN